MKIKEFFNKNKKHIPNILTGSRLLSPAVLLPLLLTGNYLGAFIALVLFLSTDAVDGFLARKWNCQSEFGAKLDAFSDKIILGTLLIPLIISNPIFLINILFEALISGINVYRKIKGNDVHTIQIGRIKMISLCILIGMGYLNNIILLPKILLGLPFLSTTILQTISSVFYIEKLIDDNKKKGNNNKTKVVSVIKEKSTKDVETLTIDKGLEKLKQLEQDKRELQSLRDYLMSTKQELVDKNRSKTKTK